MKTIVCLGRYGDIINALPVAYAASQRGQKPYFVVAEEFKSILDGVSYVQPKVWRGRYDEVQQCLSWLKATHPGKVQVYQAHNNPDIERLTRSYQMEPYRVNDNLDDFGTTPLVFDKRDLKRERELMLHFTQDRPTILVGAHGLSSPFPYSGQLKKRLVDTYGDKYLILDLDDVKAHRIYDILGLIDEAAVLVSIDTSFLHLARASDTPVVALTNDGWKGSIPPPQTAAVFRYSQVNENLDDVMEGVQLALLDPQKRRVIHVANVFGQTERHLRARATWTKLHEMGMVGIYHQSYTRDARSIGDPRPLSYLKDILQTGLEKADYFDIVCWCNDDVALDPDILDWAKQYVGKYGACSMRRLEPHGGVHLGRDTFLFTAKWLNENWHEFPDYIIGASDFDLGVTAMIRSKRGLVTNMGNMTQDLFPADASVRYSLHEPHESAWLSPDYHRLPSTQHNRREFKKWAARYSPRIQFDNRGIML